MALAKPWVHRNFTEPERRDFLELYADVEAKHPLFKWMKKSDTNLLIWFLAITLYGAGSFYINWSASIPYQIFMILCGIFFGTQPVFDSEHCGAHGSFLEYETYKLGNPRGRKHPVHYFADYHHHHTPSDNWAPNLSYHTTEGSRNIIAAHWTGFTLIGSPKIPFVLMMAYFCPQTALYFYGYELGALILPIAHGWQHISHTLVPPPVRVLFFIFEFIGIVANKDDHGRHHVHTTPTVYQAFTSSGIFNAKLDHFVDILWDMAYNEAARNPSQTKPYDIINPWVKGIQIFCLAIMPFIVPYFYVPACCYLAIHLLRIPPPFVSAIVLNILYYAYFA